MKIKMSISLSLSLLIAVALLCSSMAWGATPYKLYLGDKEIKFDSDPYEVNNRLLVPIRTISEATGAKVEWDGKANAAAIYRGSDKLVLYIGSSKASYNDIDIPLDVSPILKNGRTFLPLRFVSEWLGLQVNYEGGAIKMYKLPSLQHSDTMKALKGNSNANLNNVRSAIIWQNTLFYWSTNQLLISEDLTSKEKKELSTSPFPNPKYFNLWQDQLYVNLNGNFVKINSVGNTQQTILENIGYCQIHDGWLYYIRMNDRQFCRRLLAGGNVQPLEIFSNGEQGEVLEFVITDQHIYVNDGYSLLRMNLDGSGRRRLLSFNVEQWHLNGLEYANGLLYFNVGGNTRLARVCQINLDGTGLKKVIQDGASEINAIGDWLYYTKLGVIYTTELNGKAVDMYGGCDIARVRLDGSGREIFTQSPGQRIIYISPTLMPDGNIYYCENELASAVIWHKIAKPEALSHIN